MKKLNPLKQMLAVFLSICIAFSCSGCSNLIGENGLFSPDKYFETASKQDNEEFSEYVNKLFRESVESDALTLHSYLQHPESYGIIDYEVTLGGYDLENLDATKDITEALTSLKAFDRATLSKKQQITYDQLIKYWETELEYSDLYLFDTSLSTTIGIQVQLPIILAEYSFAEEKDVVDYIGLLKDTDKFFKNLVDYENIRSQNGYFMEDTLADEIIAQCRTFIESADDGYLISTFDERIDALSVISEADKAEYKAENAAAVSEHVIKAYEILADGLTALKGTGKYSGGLANYPDGKKYYEYLVNSDMGWTKSIDEYNSLLDTYIRNSLLRVEGLLAKEPGLYDLFDSFSFSISEPDKCLNDLKAKIQNDFPEGPDINFNIKYITESLQDFASPAMYFTPQLDNLTENSIYINPSSTDTSDLYATLAHEGYPGHMYQITYFAAGNPDMIRFLIEPGGFIEGWATYCEAYSYTLDNAGNAALNLLYQANYITTLCIYAKVDIGVNYYGWNVDDVYKYISSYGYNDTGIASDMYYSMVSEPANYCRYVLGYIGFCELRDSAKDSLGSKFNLKDFHKYILDLGPVPFDMLFEELDDWIKEYK